MGNIQNGKKIMKQEAEYIKRYPEAALIVAMAESTWSGNHKTAKIEFSLSDNLKAKLKELLGKKIHKIFITDSDVRHIKNHHGKNEEKRGQIDITPADFAFIPVVMNEFNTIKHTGEDKSGYKKLLFTKKLIIPSILGASKEAIKRLA